MRPRILITNDDGIHAPGIKHLWQSLKEIGDLVLIAPATEQSAVGVSITIRQPLFLQQVDWPEKALAWCVNGTPADCVKLALSVIFEEKKPDMIVSGINRGANSGRNILYSGTVGGAIEGVMHDIPSIAFSCRDFLEPNYPVAEKYVPRIVQYAMEHPLPSGTLLNVNFPEKKWGVKGFKMTRQGKEYWTENPAKRFHPVEGHPYYWLGARLAEFEEHEESDITWLRRGYLTAVPIHVGELTDYNHLKEKKEEFEKLFD